jgi:ABC-type multidrug transport system fused ATPase/permease subunit
LTERRAEPTNEQHRGSTSNGETRALRRTLVYLRSYKRETFGAFLALLLASAANLITPQLIAYAVDSGIEARGLEVILLAVGGLVTVALSRGLFTFKELKRSLGLSRALKLVQHSLQQANSCRHRLLLLGSRSTWICAYTVHSRDPEFTHEDA